MLYLVVETSLILLATSVVFFLLGAYYQRHFASQAAEKEETTGSWNVVPAKDDEKEWLRRRLAELEGQLAGLAKRSEIAAAPPADVSANLVPVLRAMEARLENIVERRFEALQSRIAEIQIPEPVDAAPTGTSATAMNLEPALRALETRLENIVERRFEALQSRIAEIQISEPAVASPTGTAGTAPVRPAGPDVATLNAITAVERRLTQAMANHFATLEHSASHGGELTGEIPQLVPLTAPTQVSDEHLATVVDRFAQELASVESRLTATFIDQLSAVPAHRDDAVDMRALAESFARLEERLASMPTAATEDHGPHIQWLTDAVQRIETQLGALSAAAPAASSVDRTSAPRPGLDAAPEGPTLWAADKASDPLGPQLNQLADAFQRLERHVASISALSTEPRVAEAHPETQQALRTLTEAVKRIGFQIDTMAIPSAGQDQTAEVRALAGAFGRLERHIATMSDRPAHASINFDEINTRFDRIEQYLSHAMNTPAGPDLSPMYGMLQRLHQRFDALEFHSVMPPAGNNGGWQPAPGQGPTLWTESTTALESAKEVANEPTPEPETAAVQKELEAIASSVAALEAGTHARFDGIERQIVQAAKPPAHSHQDDDRLERIERRLEEMSVRAEQTASSFTQIATSESMDQLGEELRDSAASLERRTVALEVELARYREALARLSENARPATAPDPNADPAVIALETAKQDLGARIAAMHEALEQHLAQANSGTVDPGLEEKLDSLERRLVAHVNKASGETKSDATPAVEALRMDLAGLRVAMLQSVAANRPPTAELHGIRTEMERIRAAMSDLSEDDAPSAREIELSVRLSELERRAFEREKEFEARERRLDDEYQERVVALERELETLESKMDREEREDARNTEFEARAERIEERERQLEAREAALSERLAAIEREIEHEHRANPELEALRARLLEAEAKLARASEERREEQTRRELERRMDERLAETQKDSKELRDELRDISTMLREEPEPPPPPPPSEPPAVKELLARIDKLEDLLWEIASEARRLATSKDETQAKGLAETNARIEEIARMIEPLGARASALETALEGTTEKLQEAIAALESSVEGDARRWQEELERRFTELRQLLDSEIDRREDVGEKQYQRTRETLGERLEQLRSQLALQLERQAAAWKDAERELADRFDLKLERSLESVGESLHRELAPRFENLQMALRYSAVPAVAAAPESDGRAMARLEDRLRDIERSLHATAAAPPGDEGRSALERERRAIADELRDAERRSREKIRKLERELDAARAGQMVSERTDSHREDDMPRGRYGMSGGFIDPTRILEELDQRLSEAEERFEKLSKEGANVTALEAQLRAERDAREELEDRLRDLEHRDRDRQSSLETVLERTRNDQSRASLELRSELRREIDDRVRDAEDRMNRRAAPMMPTPMMGFGMGGSDAYSMTALAEMDRRVREALETLRSREAALEKAIGEARDGRGGDVRKQVEETVRDAIRSLERRMDALREDGQLAEPVTAALKAYTERLEAIERSVREMDQEGGPSPALEKLEDRLRELENKDKEQTTGFYADIEDLRRTVATERRTLEGKVEARLKEIEERASAPANDGGSASSELAEKMRKELEESSDRVQKQLLAMRDYVVKLDKAMKPIEERLGSFESQLGARGDDRGVTPEMLEALGERLTRLESAKPADAISGEVNAAILSLRESLANAMNRLDGIEARMTGVTTQLEEAVRDWRVQSDDRIEDLVAHIDHLQEEMREEAAERESSPTAGGIEPTELKRVEEEDLRRFREMQEKFERLEKAFGAKFEAVRHDLEANIHHSEERAHDDALALTARTDERLQKMVEGLEKLVAEKENIIGDLSERIKTLTDQVHHNPDDLTDIAGIGPKLKKKLKEEFGITTFKALATISSSDLERLAGMLLFPDRIFREDWIGQAREFHLRKYNELLPSNEAEGEMRMRLAS